MFPPCEARFGFPRWRFDVGLLDPCWLRWRWRFGPGENSASGPNGSPKRTESAILWTGRAAKKVVQTWGLGAGHWSCFRGNLYSWSNVRGVSPMWSLQESNSSSNRSGGRFHRRDGKDNPFRSVDLAALPDTKGLGPFCPHLADIDQDGDLDLILVYDSKPLFLYYQQQNGSFHLAAEDPFADISITREAGFRAFKMFQISFVVFEHQNTWWWPATARMPAENMGGWRSSLLIGTAMGWWIWLHQQTRGCNTSRRAYALLRAPATNLLAATRRQVDVNLGWVA